MEMQSVGPLTLDEDLGWYYSAPVRAGSLRGSVGQIVVPEDLIEDGKTAVDDAVAEFLTADDEGLRAAGVHAFDYYLDTVRLFHEQGWDLEMPTIAGPESVWEFVSFGAEFQVERDVDGQVYISVECECAWEPEHGLQLVFAEDGWSARLAHTTGI